MALKVHNAYDSPFLEHFLQGGITGCKVRDQNNHEIMIPGLTTKTLVFTVPLKTIIFVLPASGEDVFSFAEIKTQIETQEPLLLVRQIAGVLAITRQIVTVGINLNKTGTANPLLGFSSARISLGKVYGTPGGVAPRMLAINQIGAGHFQVITDE